jgi:hypothetical protein
MIDYSKFEEWFEAKFKGQEFSTEILRQGIKDLCQEAYSFGLVDFLDMGLADLEELSEKLGRPLNIQGTKTGRLSANTPNLEITHTKEDTDESPCAGCGRREYTMPPVYMKDGRKYCMESCTCPIHKKYHGQRCIQIRAGDTGVCTECTRVYKHVQACKVRKHAPEEVFQDPDGYDEYDPQPCYVCDARTPFDDTCNRCGQVFCKEHLHETGFGGSRVCDACDNR